MAIPSSSIPAAIRNPPMWTLRIVGLLVIFCWHAFTIELNLGYYDEGLAVVGAERVMAGDLPYRDFWTLYAPGNFYFIATVFATFGKQLLASRLASLLAIVAALGLLEWICSRMLRRPGSILATIGIGICAKMPWGAPTTLAMLPVLAAAAALLRWTDTHRLRWAISAGVAAGIAVFVRHDFGIYIATSACVFLIAKFLSSRDYRADPMKAVASFVAAFIATSAAAYSYLIVNGGWTDLLQDLIVFPFTVYPSVRKIPWPGFLDALSPTRFEQLGATEFFSDLAYRLPFAIGIVVPMLGLTAWAMRLQSRDGLQLNQQRSHDTLGFCSIASIVFLSQARIRPDYGHMVPSLMLSIPIFCHLAGQLPRMSLRYIAIVGFWPAILGSQVVEKARDLQACYFSPTRINCGLPRAVGIVVDREKDVAVQAVQFVRSATRAEDFIYVGHTRHDRILAGATLFYFLAERRCPNPYQEMHPGLTTTEAVQREIVESLNAKDVQLLVLYDESAAPQEPNASAESSGVHLLDDYIKSNYRRLREFGCYHIWIRK